MRRFSDDLDAEKVKILNAEPWQLELLKLNPPYTCWGPHEDYMFSTESGWTSPVFVDNWNELGFGLDDYNEVVNFYFQVIRESEGCDLCEEDGFHTDAKWVSDSFYNHSSPFSMGKTPPEQTLKKYNSEFRDFCNKMSTVDRKCWSDKITQEEVNYLIDNGRLCSKDQKGLITAQEVNESNRKSGSPTYFHDGINRSILIEYRCEQFGIPIFCEKCNGKGYIYTEPKAHVSLVLWVLHPRKGASRGVEVKNIKKENLPEIYEYLTQAHTRNFKRFSQVLKAIA